jgi:hypothetical protein
LILINAHDLIAFNVEIAANPGSEARVLEGDGEPTRQRTDQLSLENHSEIHSNNDIGNKLNVLSNSADNPLQYQADDLLESMEIDMPISTVMPDVEFKSTEKLESIMEKFIQNEDSDNKSQAKKQSAKITKSRNSTGGVYSF